MLITKKIKEFIIETVYPDYWNIKNNIPAGLWVNCNMSIRVRDYIPFLRTFCSFYLALKIK